MSIMVSCTVGPPFDPDSEFNQRVKGFLKELTLLSRKYNLQLSHDYDSMDGESIGLENAYYQNGWYEFDSYGLNFGDASLHSIGAGWGWRISGKPDDE